MNINEYKNLINSGKICPYCQKSTEYIDSKYIYGKSYGMIYICKPCNAYVGVHKGTNKSLGRLADKKLREFKKEAHYWFDQISKTNKINEIWKKYIPKTTNRRKAYIWLSKQLEIDEKDCHIGMMNEVECKAVIDICKPLLKHDN